MPRLSEEVCKIKSSKTYSDASCSVCNISLSDPSSYVSFMRKIYCSKPDCQDVRVFAEEEFEALRKWFADCDFRIPASVISFVISDPIITPRKNSVSQFVSPELAELAEQLQALERTDTSASEKQETKEETTDNSFTAKKRGRGGSGPRAAKAKLAVRRCHICKKKVRTLQALQCGTCETVYCSYCLERNYTEKCIVCRGECVCSSCVREAFTVDLELISTKHQKTQVS
mmetsp:Transcript_29643/g.52901  ORF Transcript_29643/g.52901 Transcript_29643/m.52901 type:complete len:229 (-) Transcript_29643:2492-3178(-)